MDAGREMSIDNLSVESKIESTKVKDLPSLEWWIWFLIGVLPFCNIAKLPPDGKFWSQWAGSTLVMLWIGTRIRTSSGGFTLVSFPACVIAFFAMATALQIALGMALFPMGALVVISTLALATVACTFGADITAASQGSSFIGAFSAGLLVALVLNFLATLLGLAGYEVYLTSVLAAAEFPRAVGLVGQSNHLAALAVLSVASAIYLVWIEKIQYKVLWAIGAMAAFVCSVSGSRIAIVEWTVMLALAFIAQPRLVARRAVTRSLRRRELFILAAVFVATQVAWLYRPIADGVPSSNIARIDSQGRTELLRDSIELWTAHPWIGVGEGNFAERRLNDLHGSLTEPNAAHAHNLIAHSLAEWGTLGGIAAAGCSMWVALWAWRSVRRKEVSAEDYVIATWMLCLLAYSMVEHPLWFTRFLLPFATLMGMLRQPKFVLPRNRRLNPMLVSGVAIFLAVGISVVSAADYLRSQRLALRLQHDIESSVEHIASVPLSDASSIANLTMFPIPAQIMLTRALPMNDEYIDQKLIIATKAMSGIPTAETMARYLAFALIAGKSGDAMQLADSLMRRNAEAYAQMMEILSGFTTRSPSIKSFVEARAPLH